MEKEKQIEEMAKVIVRRSKDFRNLNVAFMTTAKKTAESLYNAGYRKASDVAEELLTAFRTEVHKLVSINGNLCEENGDEYYEGRIDAYFNAISLLAELTKKYTEEVK